MASCHSQEWFSDTITLPGLAHEKGPSWQRMEAWSVQTHDLKATGEGEWQAASWTTGFIPLSASSQPSSQGELGCSLVKACWILLFGISFCFPMCRFPVLPLPPGLFYVEHRVHEHTMQPAEEHPLPDSARLFSCKTHPFHDALLLYNAIHAAPLQGKGSFYISYSYFPIYLNH